MKLSKHTRHIMLAMSVAATALITSVNPVQAANKTIRAAYIISDQHPLVPSGLNHIIETVQQEDDSISFRTFPSGQLGKAADSITMLQNGLADIGLIVVPYHRQELPMSQAIN